MEKSQLLLHAERKLKLKGMFDKNADYEGALAPHILKIIEVFVEGLNKKITNNLSYNFFIFNIMSKNLRKIKKLTVISGEGVRVFKVEENGVFKILDLSIEWENGINFIYAIYAKDGTVFSRIENCPVVLDFI